jgi:biopolymer transport protein TolR
VAGPIHSERKLLAEINVTSLVDVMTVLLIMFAIVAPISMSGLDVRVPRTESDPLPSDEAVVVSIDDEGRVFVDQLEVRPEALGDVLAQVRTSRGIQRVYVRGDETISYGRVAEMMSGIREAGFTDVGLVFEPPPKPRR